MQPVNLSSSYESGFVFDWLKRKCFELGLDTKRGLYISPKDKVFSQDSFRLKVHH